MVVMSSDDAAATRGGRDCRPEGLEIFNMGRVLYALAVRLARV
jgi:hypothetical protein